MQYIARDGTVRKIRPQFHATLHTSMRVMEAVFGPPDLTASSMWIFRVEQDAGRPKQVIVCPDLAATGFDPRCHRERGATWVLVSDSTDPSGQGGAFAPVIAAVSGVEPHPRYASRASGRLNAAPAVTLVAGEPGDVAAFRLADATGTGGSETDGGTGQDG
jgi:hypothetical protein